MESSLLYPRAGVSMMQMMLDRTPMSPAAPGE
jgi:hypothetical protein